VPPHSALNSTQYAVKLQFDAVYPVTFQHRDRLAQTYEILFNFFRLLFVTIFLLALYQYLGLGTAQLVIVTRLLRADPLKRSLSLCPSMGKSFPSPKTSKPTLGYTQLTVL